MSDSMIYAADEPDVAELAAAYNGTITELGEYFQVCQTSYDDRRNLWAGKSSDLRKNGANAFPWQGASDQEVNVVGERIDTYVSIFDQALHRSHIKAFPTSVATMGRASVVSAFLKWMRTSYIPDFKGQMELGSNYLLEKGLMITYVGWTREDRTRKQILTLDQIAQTNPEVVDAVLSGMADDDIVILFQNGYGVSKSKAKKITRDLRKKGEAEFTIASPTVDCPLVYACAPDGEVIFPSYVTEPQRSPWIMWRTFMTAQELEKKATQGWDRAWVDYMIANMRGKDSHKMEGERGNRSQSISQQDDEDLCMVVYAYQRLIDDEDGSEGIYCTVFHPDALDAGKGYAKHELLNGYDDYPFVVTRLTRDQKRLYESAPMSKALRGPQMQIKTERDSRVDRASLATMPPLMHPAGRPPGDWGPGRRVPYRRLGEIAFGPTPPMDPGSIEVEMAMRQQADRAVGLDLDNPLAGVRQQYYVGKFLDHVRDVLALAWKLYQRMGPDEIFFQVTGIADPQTMTKGSADENYSITVDFDSRMTDPETAESQVKQMGDLMQYDRNGRINADKLLELAANAISPVLADYVIQPQEVAAEKMQSDVTDDLSKIFAGIEVPARPNGAAYALQMVQQYAQQPDIAQRLQNDEMFAERLQRYSQQYMFMIQQHQNAQIGRIGTNPASMGAVNLQQMQQ